MSTKADKIRKRVAKGAAWLDRQQPGWARKIRLTDLELRDAEACVLGQLARRLYPDDEWVDYSTCLIDFTDGCKYPKLKPLTVAMLTATRRGFNLGERDNTPEAWGALNEAWRQQIRARRQRVSS